VSEAQPVVGQEVGEPGAVEGGRFFGRLEAGVGRAVVGARDALRLLTVALLAEGHALIEDVPGTGKTTLARAFARVLRLSFARVQGTPDLLPGDVTGSSVFEAGRFRFESVGLTTADIFGRSQGSGSFRLDLLAADVVLERFAGRRLPDREVRRAVERARRPRLGSDGGAR